MVVIYVRRKFIHTLSWIIGILFLIFISLQVKSVQKYILNTFICADFEKISGFFPFKFSIYKLKLTIDKTEVFSDAISFSLGKNLNKIKNIDINSLEIISPKTELNNIDFKFYLPFFTQKIVRKLHINSIKYNDAQIGSLHVSMAPKLHSSNILFETPDHKKIMVTVKFTDEILHIRGSLESVMANVAYNINTEEISAVLSKQNQDIVSMHGILKPDSLNGILTLTDSLQNIAFKASIAHDTVSIEGYHEYANGIMLGALYDLNINQVFVNKLNIGDRVFCRPFTISQELKIQNIEIAFPKGKITVSNIDLNSDSFNPGQWKFENIDISELQKEDTNRVCGVLNGTGDFKGGTEHFDLNISNIEYGAFKSPSIKMKGRYSQDGLDLKILYNILKKTNSIDIKADFNNWIIDEKTKINVNAKGFFILEDSIKKIDEQIIRGKLKYNLLINGTVGDPSFHGVLVVKDAVYINKSSNTFIKNGSMEASIKNKTIEINKIYATDDLRNPGTIEGKGSIFYKNGDPNININLDINSFEIMAIPEFDGKLFGKINIRGDLIKEIKIDGDLFSKNAKFDISNLVNMSNYGMDILDSIKKEDSEPVKRSSQVQIPLNINFKFTPYLRIVGFGVDSTWNGGCSISGDVSDINYKFETNLEKGTIDVAGKKFTLKNGRVFCSNDTNGNINVDISAVKAIEKRKVGARFIQDASGSDVVFFSKPHASKNDVLSYMLFEKPASEISTGEALTLITAMGKVSGKGGLDVVDKIKTVFGIDSIEIKKHNNTNTGDTYSAISIGKKIGKLKVSVDQGAYNDTTSVFVEAEVAKNTKISVDMGGANNFGGGVLWSKRY